MSKTNKRSHQSFDIPDVNWKKIKASDERHIIDLIDSYGPDILYNVDDTGFYPIHWAIVNGRLNLVKHMFEVGVSPRMKAGIYDEPEPIHFAAIEGNIQMIDLLVLHGIDINARDRSGFTPVMRAAMFGRNYKTKSSETVLHLISRGADVNITDNSGANCLHHAVGNDNEDTVHLLLNIGLDPNETTDSGHRALDLAAKSGNEYLMKLLGPLTHGITTTDTMILVAKNKKKHWREKLFIFLMIFARIVVLFGLFSTLFYAYPQYFMYYLPNSSLNVVFHTLFIILNLLVFVSLYWTSKSDPGYLPQNTEKYKKVLESKVELGIKSKMTDNPCLDPYKDIRLCHFCKSVKVNRSTHCRQCKRCVASFDHHCIYLSTCIAQNNRISFFSIGFIIFLCGLMATYLVVTIALSEDSLLTPYHWFNMLFSLQFVFIGFVLTICNIRRAAINLTQYEELRYCRLSYLSNGDGKFINPYDRGSYLFNIIDYFSTQKYNYSKGSELHIC